MRRFLSVLILLAIFGPGCTRDQSDNQELQDAMDDTRNLSRRLEYESIQDGITTKVDGEVQDTLRNRLLWREDGTEVLERVVIDDSVAVRIINPSKVPALTPTTVGGSVLVADALKQSRWVLDPSGAPPLLPPKRREEGANLIGTDPLRESIDLFHYFDSAIEAANGVVELNPDSLEYRADLDPFPHPKFDIGMKRYDLNRVPLPPRSNRQQPLPLVGSFRKMSFYVLDGKIVKVLEKIDVRGHEDFLAAREDKNKAWKLAMMQAVLEGRTDPPFKERDMAVQFKDLGEPIKLESPPEALLASLGGLFSGQPAPAAGATTSDV